MKKAVFCLMFIIAYTGLVAALGGYFVNLSSPEYAALKLPSFMPPSIVFVFAWTIIYIFTAAGAYISCKSCETGLLYVYALNGALNALWTYVFFDKNNITLGLWIIFALGLTVIYLIRKSRNEGSKILLIPYFFWLCIAAILNYSVIVLN